MTVLIYRTFKTNRDFGFKDQIQRASTSIMNNIAEGFDRQSKKEFRYFLYIAKGSCSEVNSMLHLACDLEYLSDIEATELFKLNNETGKILTGFIKSLTSH